MPPTNLLRGKRPLGTIAYIATASVPEPFLWSFSQLVAGCAEYVSPPGYYVHVDHGVGSAQIMARNELVKKMQGNWLLQIDSDHVFDPDLVLRMLTLFESQNLPVLMGLYHFKEPPHNPVIYQYAPDGNYKAVLDWGQRDQVKLMPVGAAGAGCLMVRRNVFDLIKKEHNADPFSPCPPFEYDDFNFFERCRLLKIPVYCAPQIECLHLGTRGFGSEDYDPSLFKPALTLQCEVRV